MKKASYGDYVITINDNNSVIVTYQKEKCDNSIKALRYISGAVGFEYNSKWNTQQLGSKLVDHLNAQPSNETKTSQKNHVRIDIVMRSLFYTAFDYEGKELEDHHVSDLNECPKEFTITVDGKKLDVDSYSFFERAKHYKKPWVDDIGERWDEKTVARFGYYDGYSFATWEFDVEKFDVNKLSICYIYGKVIFNLADYSGEDYSLLLIYDGENMDENILQPCEGDFDFNLIWEDQKDHVCISVRTREYSYAAFDDEEEILDGTISFDSNECPEEITITVNGKELDFDSSSLFERAEYSKFTKVNDLGEEWENVLGEEWDEETVAQFGYYDGCAFKTWEFDVEKFDVNKLSIFYICEKVIFNPADYSGEDYALTLRYDGKELEICDYQGYEEDFELIWERDDQDDSDDDEDDEEE